ncbi:MAG TPA: hypothetical protein ENH40_02965 [Nitrospirae bacterium]|nr:hypothetical protein [Nitrospirota bacterium]
MYNRDYMGKNLTINAALQTWAGYVKKRPKPLYSGAGKHPWDNKKALRMCIGNSLDILKNIGMSGGSIPYVIEILMLIQEEEMFCSGTCREYPWSNHRYPSIFGPSSFSIKKCTGGGFIEVKDPPEFIYEKLFKLLVLTSGITGKNYPDFTGGFLNIRYSLDICYKKDRYIISSSRTKELTKSSGRGRKGESQSNLAMYMLYRYLKEIGFRGIYKTIASLCNAFSTRFFRQGTGAPLSTENVRKRVQ